MKFIKQFLWITAFCLAGELLKYFIPLPIPAGIYGMALMFIALETGLLKVAAISDTARFLIDVMPIMFIPAGVGLISSWDALKPIWLQVVVITLVSTVLVMGFTGLVTQAVIRREGRKHE